MATPPWLLTYIYPRSAVTEAVQIAALNGLVASLSTQQELAPYGLQITGSTVTATLTPPAPAPPSQPSVVLTLTVDLTAGSTFLTDYPTPADKAAVFLDAFLGICQAGVSSPCQAAPVTV